MTRLMKALVLVMLCGGLAALPAAAQTHSQLQAQINALQAQMAALQGQMAQMNNALQGQIAQMNNALQGHMAQTNNVLQGHMAQTNNALQGHMAQMVTLQSLINSVAADIPDCMTTALGAGGVDDVIFTGCNVHVQNGQGITASSNGVGNLIIGYNEDDVFINPGHPAYGANDRGGSHNVVIGPEHIYSSYGGLVAGYSNTVSGDYASVSGGAHNTASGIMASVSGGWYNKASAYYASVSGGDSNEASAPTASVSGGFGNEASGTRASVSGGDSRTASGQYNWRAGGLSQSH